MDDSTEGTRRLGDPFACFAIEVGIYWEDTDAGGVVYHANYLKFMERARSDWFESLGHSQGTLRDEADLVFAVRSADLRFLGPARLGDRLQVTSTLKRLRGASLDFEQSVIRRTDGCVLVTGQIGVACLSASGFRPSPIPANLFGNPSPLP